jgi:hypothetical protein
MRRRRAAWRAAATLRCRLFLVVHFGVLSGGLVTKVHGLGRVTASGVTVMARLLVIAAFVMLGGFAMMLGGAVMMFGGGHVMLRAFVG